MDSRWRILNPVVAALAGFLLTAPVAASETGGGEDVAALLAELQKPDQEGWRRLERQITRAWSRSGSASADLLLQRGREAMRAGQTAAALEHFTALIDHAPEFAEAYHARATAWFMDGKLGRALDDLRAALAYNPSHFSALAGLGRIFEDLQQFDRAREAYRAAATIHPHRADVKTALDRLNKQLDGTAL
jgi:Tfp pilus assembly protein PilF